MAGGGDLPIFIEADMATLTLSIATNKKMYAGIYDLEFIGSMNPYLI